MIKVAVVEDDPEHLKQIRKMLRDYGEKQGIDIRVTSYMDAEELLHDFSPVFDIILLDIELPGADGMEAAFRVREADENVVLMFVTNMAQYAIRGYEVGALDFILKPVNEYTFSLRFARAVERVRKNQAGELLLSVADGVRRQRIDRITYVEIQNRMLHYHTLDGEFVMRGTLKSVEKELVGYPFVKCNHWYLVNLRHVEQIRRERVVVAGRELEISRRNKTAFLTALTNYAGGKGVWGK